MSQLRRRTGRQTTQARGQTAEQPRVHRAGLQAHRLRCGMSAAQPVREVLVPTSSGLMRSLKRLDFADAYEGALSQPTIDIGDAYAAIFAHELVWVRWLMNLRGFIAVPLGLAHTFDARPIAAGEKPRFQAGVRAGIFTVQSVSTDEIIVGDDDQHLNFRISVLKTEREGQCFVTVSTGVEIHNRLGHTYMFVVKPFHRFLASYMVGQAVKTGRL